MNTQTTHDRMIQLRLNHSRNVAYVNPAHILYVEEGEWGTDGITCTVHMATGERLRVAEGVDDVYQIIEATR